MSKKSVVLVVVSMNIGGVEKALLGVVKKFLTESWDVHVAMLQIDGGFLEYIPQEVTIHQITGFENIKHILHAPPRQIIREYINQSKYFAALRHLWYYVNIKLSGSALRLYRHEFKKIPPLSDKIFDLAIAFAGPDAFIDHYVTTRIHAKEKWGWIHFDISKFGIDKGIMSDSGRRYHRINVVSQKGKYIFDKKFPFLKVKTQFVPNIVDQEAIIGLSKDKIDIPEMINTDVILTVGRVSSEKGQFLTLQAIRILIDKGYCGFTWWVVGSGIDIDRCKTFAEENNLQNFVHFFGPQVNPYPYFAKCDLYLQPSLHEGFCITLAEAKLFNKPILATNFTGADEQLKNYRYPHKVVGFSKESIADGIEWFLTLKKTR